MWCVDYDMNQDALAARLQIKDSLQVLAHFIKPVPTQDSSSNLCSKFDCSVRRYACAAPSAQSPGLVNWALRSLLARRPRAARHKDRGIKGID